MSIFEGTIYSESLKMMTSLTVTLPAGSKFASDGGEMPVVYLLHGLTDNHSAWVRRTNADYYAEQAGIALVMPEVQRSFYTDMAHGVNYFTYIAEELPALCRKMFRLSSRREDNFIAGLSMGGYGALKTAFRYPGRFAAAGSFSGAVDIRKRFNETKDLLSDAECYAINECVIKPDEDLFALAEQVAETKADCPRLYISCGETDFMIEDNRRFHQHLMALSLPHTYEEWPGGHEWAFWDRSIQNALRFFLPSE